MTKPFIPDDEPPLREIALRIADATETPLGGYGEQSEDRRAILKEYERLRGTSSFSDASRLARAAFIEGVFAESMNRVLAKLAAAESELRASAWERLKAWHAARKPRSATILLDSYGNCCEVDLQDGTRKVRCYEGQEMADGTELTIDGAILRALEEIQE